MIRKAIFESIDLEKAKEHFCELEKAVCSYIDSGCVSSDSERAIIIRPKQTVQIPAVSS